MKYAIALSALAAITLVSAQDECSQDFDGYFEYNPVPIEQGLTKYPVSKVSPPQLYGYKDTDYHLSQRFAAPSPTVPSKAVS